jgi:hypothetical protein
MVNTGAFENSMKIGWSYVSCVPNTPFIIYAVTGDRGNTHAAPTLRPLGTRFTIVTGTFCTRM